MVIKSNGVMNRTINYLKMYKKHRKYCIHFTEDTTFFTLKELRKAIKQ